MKKVHTIKKKYPKCYKLKCYQSNKVDRAALKTQMLPVHGQGRQGSLSKSQSSGTKSELQFGFKKKKMPGQPSERHVKVTFIPFSATQVYQPHPQHTSFHFHWVSGGNNRSMGGWSDRSSGTVEVTLHGSGVDKCFFNILEMSRVVLKRQNFQR